MTAFLQGWASWTFAVALAAVGLLLVVWAAVHLGATKVRAFREALGLPDEEAECLRGQRVSQRRRDVSPVRQRVEAEIARAERRRLREGWGDDPLLAQRYREHGEGGEAA